MKVAFVTNYSSSDRSAWSGSMYNMLGAFERSGLDIHIIDKLYDPYSAMFKAKRLVRNAINKKNYLRDREPLTLKWYAWQVERRLRGIKPDLIFSAGTIPIAYLNADQPIVFWADATFDGMIDFYPEYTNLCDDTIRNGHGMEQSALSNCRLAIYSSKWAADTAIANYAVDKRKVRVVPYGANLAQVPSMDEVEQAMSHRALGDGCKLLFVGVDWRRKGGEKAVLVTARLRDMGVDAELHVVGCRPPTPLPEFVKVHGYLSRSNREHNEILSDLYRASEFFILPSEAECAAVVVAEANAFGLPALTTNVGGMGTVVSADKNGRTFDGDSFVAECAEYIVQVMSSRARYHQLCVSSSREYCTRLNWDSAVRSVLKMMAAEDILSSAQMI